MTIMRIEFHIEFQVKKKILMMQRMMLIIMMMIVTDTDDVIFFIFFFFASSTKFDLRHHHHQLLLLLLLLSSFLYLNFNKKIKKHVFSFFFLCWLYGCLIVEIYINSFNQKLEKTKKKKITVDRQAKTMQSMIQCFIFGTKKN